MKALSYLHAQATLGEGPLWDDVRNCLFFVDIEGKKLHKVVDGEDTSYDMPSRIGTVGLTKGSRLVVALENGLHLFDPDSGELTFFAQPETDRTGNRGNDGKPDPAGNMWIGTMPMEQGKVGGLYRVAPDGSSVRVLDGLGCANGMGWSPDHKTMYFIDTPSRAVFAFDYDEATGDVKNQRIVVNFDGKPQEEGSPDGMTVDAQGKLWVAQWGGMQVACYDNITGQKLAQVDVPAPCVTCPTFGGENLDKLFITTAGFGRDKYPLGGNLFVADVGVRGMKAFRFDVK